MATRGRKVRKRKPAKRKRSPKPARRPPKKTKRSATPKKRKSPAKRQRKKLTRGERAKLGRAATRARKVQRALVSAKRVFDAQGFSHDAPGWVPQGGWQGDELAEEVSYMTHEEKIDWLEWLAEQLDTTISELFDMMGSP